MKKPLKIFISLCVLFCVTVLFFTKYISRAVPGLNLDREQLRPSAQRLSNVNSPVNDAVCSCNSSERTSYSIEKAGERSSYTIENRPPCMQHRSFKTTHHVQWKVHTIIHGIMPSRFIIPTIPIKLDLYTSKPQEKSTYLGCAQKDQIRGTVFDCITRQHVKQYDEALLDKFSKPLSLSSGQQAEDPETRKLSFMEIFQKQTWGGKEAGVNDPMSENFKASGPGSSLVNTQGCMAMLHSVIEQLKVDLNKDVINIADIPCGDLQWISHFLKTRPDVNYTGIDIVPELIQRHTNTYRNFKNINFINTDVVQSPLTMPFDIIFSRQMMQHFPNADIQRVLYHFSTSGSKYMIATTYSDVAANVELPSTKGTRYRQVNLEIKPFNLVPPVCFFQETQQRDNFLGMWELPLKVKQ